MSGQTATTRRRTFEDGALGRKPIAIAGGDGIEELLAGAPHVACSAGQAVGRCLDDVRRHLAGGAEQRKIRLGRFLDRVGGTIDIGGRRLHRLATSFGPITRSSMLLLNLV
jgi:hypothetical protein